MANLLAAEGLSVCFVEKFREVYPRPWAIVLDWEVMRALQYCGIAHALHPSTRPHPGTDFVGIDGEIIKIFDLLPPPYALGWPATSTFIQPTQAFIPDLAGGILGGDALSGSLMVQPEVADKDRTRLMDDLIPMAFLYVTDGQGPQAWMSPHAAFWKRLGGERIAFVTPETGAVDGVRAMTETGRIFAGWADARSVRAAIVRPDRYVYAAVTDAQDLADKLQRLADQLGVSRSGGQHGDAGSR